MKRLRDAKMLSRIDEAVNEVRQAASLTEVRNVKALRAPRAFYRIRVGGFRLGLELLGGTAIFLRCLPRKQIYREFP